MQEPYLPFDPKAMYASLMAQYRSEGKVNRALIIVLVIAIASSLIALANVIAVPREGESFTEFYYLGQGHQASGYPHNLTVDESAYVYVGIVNHEHLQVYYYIQTWLVNASFVDNHTVVNQMYYFEQFDVVLEHVPVDLDKPWTLQW